MDKEEYSDSCICCFPEVIAMAFTVDTNVQPRKEWVAPELKKINIEEITAHVSGTKPKPDVYNSGESS
jgi:hypothetical protein